MTPSNEMCPICDYAGSAIYCEWPGPEQRRGGVIPLDSLPAAWWNNMWGDTTKRINEARDMIGQLITEVNNVLAQAGICPSDVCTDQLYQSINLIRQRLATTTTAGSVVGSADANKVAVAADGTMTVNCFGNANSLTTAAHTITGAINELKSTYDSCISGINSAVAGKAPTSHASSATTYGVGTASVFGHLKISDTYATVVGAATDGIAASQKALNDVYAYASACAARIIDLGNTAGCSLGTASAGVSGTAARSDHVHPMPTCVACAGYANDAGTVAGYSVADAATASTVALRNSGGHLYATIFHDNWSAENINSYADATLMFRSSDGFIRNTAPSNVSVGYATSAGSAGYATSAGSAGTAGNSATLGGYGPAANNSVNSVVVRDGNGNIYAGYYNTASVDENMGGYPNARVMFADCNGWIRKALPDTVSVGYATNAGYAGSAGSAGSSNAVHGGMIRAGWSVYPVNNSTICNTNDFNALAIIRQGSSIYLTIVPAHDVASVSNCADGWDSWIAIWGA